MSTYNGKDYVEEHREKITDSNGNVHLITKRRLGDRWYESESKSDESGKITSKEIWHNVPDDAIEQFKLEWAEKHTEKYSSQKKLELKKEEGN